MNCDRCRDLLPLKATGDLDNRERDELERHLTECVGCRNEAAEFDQLTTSLTRSDADQLTELERIKLENALMHRVIERQAGRWPVSIVPAHRILVRLAASIVLVISGFFLNSFLRVGSGDPGGNGDKVQLALSTVSESPAVATGHRYSAAGLKLIARGKSALADQ